ncbi:MAG TPA: hypothetical protein VHO68_10780 [Bacteroidales bacterium]|nr:hypothetical protein [Bacteroidales bacterium]
MMNRILQSLTLLLLLYCTPSLSQETLNFTDPKGMKQGHWIKKYPNGAVMYDGFFKDDHPVGEFKRFYDTTIPRSVLIYSADGREAEATLYHPDGTPASKGKYVNQKKEGKWQFYSPDPDGFLISEENYSENRRNGLSVKYYPDGKMAEKVSFLNDQKNGEWIKYYENGKTWIRSVYKNGRLNGRFETWFEDGVPEFTGQYVDDARNGQWVIYNKNGTVRYKMEYINGSTKDRQMDIDASNFIDSLERTSSKVEDPEKSGGMW